jgi:hypothetical protein
MKKENNLTTYFGLPLLGWNKAMYEPFLINTYIKHDLVEGYEDCVFILMEWSDDSKFKKVEDILTKHKSHQAQYDVDSDGKYVMFIHKIPDKYIVDYRLYLDGKYSQMSKNAKNLVKASSIIGETIHQILNKDKKLWKHYNRKCGPLEEDAEVWPCVADENILKNEVFTEETFNKLVNQ